MSVASTCNACAADTVSDPQRATIYTYDAAGTNAGRKLFARGLRNAEGLAFVPGTARLWVVVNNRDNTLVPDDRDADGDGSGDRASGSPRSSTTTRWSRSRGARGRLLRLAVLQPEQRQRRSGRDAVPPRLRTQPRRVGGRLREATPIDVGIQAHSAPLGAHVHARGTKAPDLGAVIALHGSWNRSHAKRVQGHLLPVDVGRAGGGAGPRDGVPGGEGPPWGRPVDIAVDTDGSLLVSDDFGGCADPVDSARHLTAATRVPVGLETRPGGARQDGRMEFDTLWDFSQPAVSEERFRTALAQTGAAGTQALLLRTQIARALGLQGRFDDCAAELDAVASDRAATGIDLPIVDVYLRLEAGRMHRSAGRPAEATPLFLEALNGAQAAGLDSLAADAAHMLAIVGPPESQIEWAEKAREIASASTDRRARRWLGAIENNVGWTLHDLGRFEEAQVHFERALEAHRDHGDAERVRVARWTVARGLRSLGRLDEALAIQQELAEHGPADGYVEEEAAELLDRPGPAGRGGPLRAAGPRVPETPHA